MTFHSYADTKKALTATERYEIKSISVTVIFSLKIINGSPLKVK